jgi:hypothetical protein
MSAQGVPKDDSIIIRLNYRLVAAMAGCLLLFVTVVMALVSYCLHQEWNIDDISRKGYRMDNFDIDIKHTSDDVYGLKQNDFARLPSRPRNESSEEEDDVDDINMEIYQDLLEAGKQFLDTYNDAKDRRKKNQRARRKRLTILLSEFEE